MIDLTQFTRTTDANTKKYLTNTPFTISFNSAAVSVGVGSYATSTYIVPLSTETRFYELWTNVSLDGSLYIKIPSRDRLYAGTSQNIAITVRGLGSSVEVILYLVNQSGTTQTFPAFTLNVIRRDYVDS